LEYDVSVTIDAALRPHVASMRARLHRFLDAAPDPIQPNSPNSNAVSDRTSVFAAYPAPQCMTPIEMVAQRGFSGSSSSACSARHRADSTRALRNQAMAPTPAIAAGMHAPSAQRSIGQVGLKPSGVAGPLQWVGSRSG
jgi:hypothetical protein